ncbi:MAG: hypothetical protein ACR2QU_01565 [Gammaproteobacteria bacterium]
MNQYLPLLMWIRSYQKPWLRPDVVAGLTALRVAGLGVGFGPGRISLWCHQQAYEHVRANVAWEMSLIVTSGLC